MVALLLLAVGLTVALALARRYDQTLPGMLARQWSPRTSPTWSPPTITIYRVPDGSSVARRAGDDAPIDRAWQPVGDVLVMHSTTRAGVVAPWLITVRQRAAPIDPTVTPVEADLAYREAFGSSPPVHRRIEPTALIAELGTLAGLGMGVVMFARWAKAAHRLRRLRAGA